MENSNAPSRIEPATFRFVAQHLKHCATAVPVYIYIYIYIYTHTHTHCVCVCVCERLCARADPYSCVCLAEKRN